MTSIPTQAPKRGAISSRKGGGACIKQEELALHASTPRGQAAPHAPKVAPAPSRRRRAEASKTSSDQAFVSTHPQTSLINQRRGFRNHSYFIYFFGLQATVLSYSSIFINAYSTWPYICFKCFKTGSPEVGGRVLLSRRLIRRVQRAETLNNITHSCRTL